MLIHQCAHVLPGGLGFLAVADFLPAPCPSRRDPILIVIHAITWHLLCRSYLSNIPGAGTIGGKSNRIVTPAPFSRLSNGEPLHLIPIPGKTQIDIAIQERIYELCA